MGRHGESASVAAREEGLRSMVWGVRGAKEEETGNADCIFRKCACAEETSMNVRMWNNKGILVN